MEYRALGNSTLKVSTLGLGCLHFGLFSGQRESESIILAALDAGVNFFETAPMYGNGNSEAILGKALRGRRREALISTKVGLVPTTNPDGSFAVKVAKLDRRLVKTELEKSLRALGTDYIDLYQIHAFDSSTPFEETVSALMDAVREGKVRYFGCSNHSPAELEMIEPVLRSLAGGHFVAAQCHYNMIERKARLAFLPYCRQKGWGVICNRVLARGALSGKYLKNSREYPRDSRAASSPRVAKWLNAEKLELIDLLSDFASKRNRSLADLAVAWVLQDPAIGTALLGVRNLSQLEANLAAASSGRGDGDLAEIEKLIEQEGILDAVNAFPEEFLEK